MKTSIDLDDKMTADLGKASSLIHEKPATVLRLAIEAGLPLLVSRSGLQRPEGYFADDYPLPQEQLELEAAMTKVNQGPDR